MVTSRGISFALNKGEKIDSTIFMSKMPLFWNEFKKQKVIAKSSIWISTSKNIDCRIEELVLCGACGGQYLISSSVAQYCDELCLWCNHSMPMHLFSKQLNSQ